MNSGCLLKWFVSVKLQDKERPTRPALLWSSTSHTPYSNDTSGVLLLLLLLVYVNEKEWNGECLERGEWRPFYSLKGRFPPSLNMETLITAFERIRENHRPRHTWTGVSSGSAEPAVRPAPLGRLWPPPLAGWLTRGSSSVYIGAGALYVGLFCAFVLRLLLISSLFHVWVPAIQESPKLVEMVRNEPYSYVRWLNVMKRCRSWRFYFRLKDCQHLIKKLTC